MTKNNKIHPHQVIQVQEYKNEGRNNENQNQSAPEIGKKPIL